MSLAVQARLQALQAAAGSGVLAGGLRGIEKEALRVVPDGRLSTAAHPQALGSALMHPYITTDFSEALVEFVTAPLPSSAEVLEFLDELHRFAGAHLRDEVLWAASMPGPMSGDDDVPLAQYGSSNVGRMKTVYRRGLGYRYGRMMQTIAGMHFNYSAPLSLWPALAEIGGGSEEPDALRSRAYMGLVRNFRRHAWLVLYLFGASPAVGRSFLRDAPGDLQTFDDDTLYAPWATSLRMSDIGYHNESQAQLTISANSLDEYLHALEQAIRIPHERYRQIGLQDPDGAYRQLSVNLLQIENEYYSPIRPKRRAKSGERPGHALRRGGVEYVEVRALDVNVFEPLGIGLDGLRFLEAFLLYCLLEDSPPLDAAAQTATERNQQLVAWEGRRPGLSLERGDRLLPLSDWAAEILDGVDAVAAVLDVGGDGCFARAVSRQRAALRDPDSLPSARMLAEMRKHRETYFELALRLSREYAESWRGRSQDALRRAYLERAAAESIHRQRELEISETRTFEQHLAAYFDADAYAQSESAPR